MTVVKQSHSWKEDAQGLDKESDSLVCGEAMAAIKTAGSINSLKQAPKALDALAKPMGILSLDD